MGKLQTDSPVFLLSGTKKGAEATMTDYKKLFDEAEAEEARQKAYAHRKAFWHPVPWVLMLFWALFLLTMNWWWPRPDKPGISVISVGHR